MIITKINQNTNVESPYIIAGVYNYNSGSYEGEIIPIQVNVNGEIEVTS